MNRITNAVLAVGRAIETAHTVLVGGAVILIAVVVSCFCRGVK
jgi:hypothetical protein